MNAALLKIQMRFDLVFTQSDWGQFRIAYRTEIQYINLDF